MEKNFQWTKVKGKPEDDEITRAALRVRLGLVKEEPEEEEEVTEDLATSTRLEEDSASEAQIAAISTGGKPRFGLWKGKAEPKKQQNNGRLSNGKLRINTTLLPFSSLNSGHRQTGSR